MIGFDGRMTGDIPPAYAGLTEDEAAAKVVAWLKEHDQLEKREAYRHSVGHCERYAHAHPAARARSSGGAR